MDLICFAAQDLQTPVSFHCLVCISKYRCSLSL